MADSFTTNPTVVDKFYSGPVSLRYTSRNFTNGTSYTLRSSTDTSLGSQTFTLLSTTTFSGPGTNSWAIAADSSGNVYVQRISNITTMYNSSGSVITTFTLAAVISTTSGPDQNTIYFIGSFVFGIFNVPTRTFTSSFNPGLNIWGSVYNPADGLVYVSVISVMDLYKINPTTQVLT
jgi:predicted secreted protein